MVRSLRKVAGDGAAFRLRTEFSPPKMKMNGIFHNVKM